MRCYSFSIFIVFILLFTCTAIAANFPYRDKYPEVKTIELEELKSGYDRGDFLIIDVRSRSEFDAIHIKGAVNLPFAEAKFISQLRTLAIENANMKIAVYDNGKECIKSYKAAEEALYGLIPKVYAFDAGIASWAKAFPSETLLLGKILDSASSHLISAKEINSKLLEFTTFREKAAKDNAVVIDARDPIQKVHELPGIEKSLHVPVDKLVNNIISKGHMKDKELLIFDQVGGQVNWIMYYLVENEYTNFFFLEGGATSVLKEQEYRALASVY